MTTSILKAKYMALCQAGKKALWCRNILNVDIFFTPILSTQRPAMENRLGEHNNAVCASRIMFAYTGLRLIA